MAIDSFGEEASEVESPPSQDGNGSRQCGGTVEQPEARSVAGLCFGQAETHAEDARFAWHVIVNIENANFFNAPLILAKSEQKSEPALRSKDDIEERSVHMQAVGVLNESELFEPIQKETDS